MTVKIKERGQCLPEGKMIVRIKENLTPSRLWFTKPEFAGKLCLVCEIPYDGFIFGDGYFCYALNNAIGVNDVTIVQRHQREQ